MAQNRNVSVWRATHILLYTCTIGTSLGALLSYRNMNSSLETTMSKCMLYTQPWVELNVKTGNCRIDLARTEWGGDGLCNFVLFSMLASFVYGVISVWFFIMCAPSRNLPEDDSFVHVGVNTFFYELELRVLRNCTTRAGGPAAWENDSVATLYNERLTTQIFVWLIVLCWVMAALSLVCRCLTAADFGGGGVSVHPGGELISYLGGFLSSLYRNRREPAAATARVTARQRPTLEQQRQV
ncbi:hypothetical protein MRX96_059146 [Rhipicephalus microplus]